MLCCFCVKISKSFSIKNLSKHPTNSHLYKGFQRHYISQLGSQVMCGILNYLPPSMTLDLRQEIRLQIFHSIPVYPLDRIFPGLDHFLKQQSNKVYRYNVPRVRIRMSLPKLCTSTLWFLFSSQLSLQDTLNYWDSGTLINTNP